jgi:radical SAM protein with 4Fe4S-binding SPASM domain
MYKRLKSPLSVQLEVTGMCPQLCQHCYNFWRESDSKLPVLPTTNTLSPEGAIAIIQKLSDMEVFNLVITGGEPLLNMPTTLACIKYARSKGMGVNMNSILTPLTPEKATNLKKAGLPHILTSILGPTAEVHDLVTQRKGSFKLLLERVKIAQNAGIQISANMVVSQLNFEHVVATAEVVASLGIKYFNATKAGCPGNCSDFSHLAISQEQAAHLLNSLCQIEQRLGIKVDTLEPIPLCGLHEVDHPESFLTRRCVAGVTTMTVSYDGLVRPCSHLDISCGNLLQEDLATVWEHMNPWSTGVHIPDECRKCPLLTRCGGGCRMEAKSKTGHINQQDPYASPARAAEVMKRMEENKPKNVTLPLAPARFRTARYRLRKEYFGGIVFLGGSECVFLDQRGFGMISQIQPDQVYETSRLTVDWKGLDQNKFLSGLCFRKVIHPT